VNLTVLLLAIPSSCSTGFIQRGFTVKICRVSRLCFHSSKEKFEIIPDQNDVVGFRSIKGVTCVALNEWPTSEGNPLMKLSQTVQATASFLLPELSLHLIWRPVGNHVWQNNFMKWESVTAAASTMSRLLVNDSFYCTKIHILRQYRAWLK